MAVIEGGVSGNLAEVDTYFLAQRSTLRPMQCTGWFNLGARSGALTAAAANTALFSFRNIAANLIAIRRIGIGFIATTGFTAAQQLNWGLKFARAFSASDTGGTVIALTGNEAKVRTSLATMTNVDCRISSTGALTAGTKTLDAYDMATIGAYGGAATAGNLLPPGLNNLFEQSPGGYPIILAQNEGFNIMNITAMGAGGVGTLYVNVGLAEVVNF